MTPTSNTPDTHSTSQGSNGSARHWRGQLLWGLVVVAIGITVLLNQLGYVDIGRIWRYWPLLLVILGVTRVVGYPSERELWNGFWMVLVGLWLFAVFEGLFGLTFGNSWPIFIIAAGVQMVVRPLRQAHSERRKDRPHD